MIHPFGCWQVMGTEDQSVSWDIVSMVASMTDLAGTAIDARVTSSRAAVVNVARWL